MLDINIPNMKETKFSQLTPAYAPDPDELDIFEDLRVFIDDNGNFWFIGNEVASIMGYNDIDDVIRKHVPEQYKISCPVNCRGTSDDNPNIILISELGLYALVIKSKLPKTYEF